NSSAVEHLHRLFESFADFSTTVAVRNAAIIEDHLGGFTCAHAEFVFFLPCAESGCSSLHNECSGILLRAGFTRAADNNSYFAALAMSDPTLSSVDYPIIAILRCHALHVAGIASGIRLRQAPRTQPFSRRQLWQILLLL